jgi:hypothetical protein
VGEEARRINGGGWKAMKLTPKISSSQIWVAGYFGQPLTYPNFTIFISDF